MTNTARWFDGKVVLVTGSSRGLGRAMALGFADAGADVIVSSRTKSDCDVVAGEIRALGRRALSVACDVSKWESCEALVDAALSQFDRIDVLVNNAGASFDRSSLLDISEEEFDASLAVNLKSTVRMTQLCAPHMSPGGAMINISSTASTKQRPSTFVYAAAKAAVNAFTRAAANELGAQGLRINAIACGPFATDALDGWLADPAARTAMEAESSLGVIGQPEDVVGTALWMASPASAYLQGQVVTLDGGRSR